MPKQRSLNGLYQQTPCCGINFLKNNPTFEELEQLEKRFSTTFTRVNRAGVPYRWEGSKGLMLATTTDEEWTSDEKLYERALSQAGFTVLCSFLNTSSGNRVKLWARGVSEEIQLLKRRKVDEESTNAQPAP